MNGDLRGGKLLFGDQFLQRASSFHHGAGARSVVIGAPLGMIKMPADQHFAFGMFSAAKVGVNKRQFAGTERGINLAMHAHRPLLHQALKRVILITRDLKAASGFIHLFGARPDAVIADHVRMVGPIAGGGIDHHANRAMLDYPFAYHVGGVAGG